MLNWIRKIRVKMRHKHAERIKRQAKAGLMLSEFALLLAGKRDSMESLEYRIWFYDQVDALTDDEVLEGW